MNAYATAGLLKDITADLDANGGAWRNTFSPGALAVYSYKNKSYGVPWDMGMVGFWYNKALFAKAGIAKTLPPPGPTPWRILKRSRQLALPPSPLAKGINGPARSGGNTWQPAWVVRAD